MESVDPVDPQPFQGDPETTAKLIPFSLQEVRGQARFLDVNSELRSRWVFKLQAQHVLKTASFLLLAAGLELAVAGQGFSQPMTIFPNPGPQSNRVTVAWHTVPGKTYNALTADQLPGTWSATNFNAIRASSTTTRVTHRVDRVARFYRALEQAIPAGNTGAITTTTIAEAENILSLTFAAAQRSQMLELLNSAARDLNRVTYEAMRRHHLVNAGSLALVFHPLPVGFAFELTRRPII